MKSSARFAGINNVPSQLPLYIYVNQIQFSICKLLVSFYTFSVQNDGLLYVVRVAIHWLHMQDALHVFLGGPEAEVQPILFFSSHRCEDTHRKLLSNFSKT